MNAAPIIPPKSYRLNEPFRLFFRILARYCIRRGVRLHEGIELLKHSLVSIAAEELERSGVSNTASRISVMTGVHRKDIARILEETEPQLGNRSLVSRVIGLWLSDVRFSQKGKPKALTWDGKEGAFGDLVSSVSRELNPPTILSELERIGGAERSNGEVHLRTQIYVPSGDSAEILKMMAMDTEDLCEAVEENLEGNQQVPNYHIKTEYDAIPDEFVPEIRLTVLRLATRFHERLQRYISRFDKDANRALIGKPGRNRVSVVGFSRVEKLDKGNLARGQASGEEST